MVNLFIKDIRPELERAGSLGRLGMRLVKGNKIIGIYKEHNLIFMDGSKVEENKESFNPAVIPSDIKGNWNKDIWSDYRYFIPVISIEEILKILFKRGWKKA